MKNQIDPGRKTRYGKKITPEETHLVGPEWQSFVGIADEGNNFDPSIKQQGNEMASYETAAAGQESFHGWNFMKFANPGQTPDVSTWARKWRTSERMPRFTNKGENDHGFI
jgi:hypothetical protein